MKKALITGICGQDRDYLANILLSKGDKVYGAYKHSSERSFWRLAYLDLLVDDYSKINNITGWKPSVNFSQLIEMMCSEEEKKRKLTLQF